MDRLLQRVFQLERKSNKVILGFAALILLSGSAFPPKLTPFVKVISQDLTPIHQSSAVHETNFNGTPSRQVSYIIKEDLTQRLNSKYRMSRRIGQSV